MKTGLCTFFLLYAVSVFAQQSYSPKYTFLRFENDLCEGTDEYYTSGGVLGFYTPGLGKNPLNKLMMMIPNTDNHVYGIELTQDIYTPRNTDTLHYLPDDRPFAGILLARMKRISFLPEKYIRLKTSLGLGIVGAAAFAGQTQNGVHSMINSTIYKGWFNQLGNRLLIHYDMELEKSFYTKKYGQIIGRAATELGNLRTNLSGGYLIRIGKLAPYFSSYEYKKGDDTWYASVYTDAYLTLVGYDATLNGAYQDAGQPEYTIRRLVFKAALGVNVMYKRLNMGVSHHFLTPEFSTGFSHAYDSAEIGYRF